LIINEGFRKKATAIRKKEIYGKEDGINKLDESNL
jgi:hypothetical protein